MVKNITLSADEGLIRKARQRAAREKKSLNSVFREWLEQYANRQEASKEYRELMKRLDYVKSNGPYAREEMNER